MLLYLFYTMVQKSQKWPKTQIKGGFNEWTRGTVLDAYRRWSRASYNVTDAGILLQLLVSRFRPDHQALIEPKKKNFLVQFFFLVQQTPDDRAWAMKFRVAKEFLRLLRCNLIIIHYSLPISHLPKQFDNREVWRDVIWDVNVRDWWWHVNVWQHIKRLGETVLLLSVEPDVRESQSSKVNWSDLRMRGNQKTSPLFFAVDEEEGEVDTASNRTTSLRSSLYGSS